MIKNIIHFLILILVILLPLVNSSFFGLLGFEQLILKIDGNYEFSKTIFFNIFSGIIVLFFFIQNFGKKIIFPKIIFFPIFILLISTIFSVFPLTSCFGEYTKGHGSLLFLNLILIFIALINQDKAFIKKIIKYILYSSFFVIFFALTQYFLPSFDYGDLSNRAIGTFGHPNYLALYLLILLPLSFSNFIKNIYLKYFLIFFITITLLLTKSVYAIFLALSYLFSIFIYQKKLDKKGKNILLILIFLGFFILFFIIYKFGFLTKLNSFVSRFYIWETTLKIIFSDLKIFLFGAGSDTLSYTFDIYKSKELYIFENIGFVADRPHNIFLNIFYSFGFFALGFFLVFIKNILQKYKQNSKNKCVFYSLFLFFIFLFLNFSSIVTYFIIIILLSYIYINTFNEKIKILYLTPVILLSIFSLWTSFFYYGQEYLSYNKNGYISNIKTYNKLKIENPEKKALYKKYSIEEACLELLKINTVENYFFCGDLYWEKDRNKAIQIYKKGLENFPDMRNKNSTYYNNFFIKNIFSSHRFYSEKYSNLIEILKRTETIE